MKHPPWETRLPQSPHAHLAPIFVLLCRESGRDSVALDEGCTESRKMQYVVMSRLIGRLCDQTSILKSDEKANQGSHAALSGPPRRPRLSSPSSPQQAWQCLGLCIRVKLREKAGPSFPYHFSRATLVEFRFAGAKGGWRRAAL